jgi:hypothetical protein
VGNNGNNYQIADNLKELEIFFYLYAKSTTQRCPKEIKKNFLIEDFFHFPPASTTPVANLELRISPRMLEKIRNDPKGLGAWGKQIHDKNQKQKIS